MLKMGRKILIAAILLLIVSLIGVGCSSVQQDYQRGKAYLRQAQQDLATAKVRLSAGISDFNSP
jgi:hypothetical protein